MPYSSFKNTAFQSTPSAWRETLDSLPRVGGAAISIHSLRMEGDRNCLDDAHEQIISIHSLRMEGDRFKPFTLKTILYFNPLPPHGGRPNTTLPDGEYTVFQSTPSAWRETRNLMWCTQMENIFQSTPSAWRETLDIL